MPSPDGSDGADLRARAVIGEVDRMRRMARFGAVSIVWGAAAVVAAGAVAAEPPGAVAVTAVAGTVVTAVAVHELVRRHVRAEGAVPVGGPLVRALAAVASASALATVVAAQLAADGPATWGIVPGLATGAMALTMPRARRSRVMAAGAAAAGTTAVLTLRLAGIPVDAGQVAVDAVLVVMVAAALVVGLWTQDVIDGLDRARRLESELAVADERLRFAADLHDIQGHHLHVIALHSELAARQAERDPAPAAQQMRQVHERARTALNETRALAEGYRQVSLAEELANAARVLAAAGVDGRMTAGTADAASLVPPDARHLLGLVVRETTTNVIRHSRARVAQLSLEAGDGVARLEVRNDGVVSGGVASDAGAGGTGLPGLARRLAVAGGELAWSCDGPWFAVTARVPLATVAAS